MTLPTSPEVAAPERISEQISRVLQNLVTDRNPDLAEHQGRVARLAQTIAPGLGLPQRQNAALVQAANLHDIGKLAIPEETLRKPSELDEREWEMVRQHTVVGGRILIAAGALDDCAAFVRSSHERFDGDGYPDGLAGDQIPLGARIIAVCDAYDAMTSSRPYRPRPMSDEGAREELRSSAGSQFDPAVVSALRALSAR